VKRQPEPAPEVTVTAEWTARPPDERDRRLAELLFGPARDRDRDEGSEAPE
jgi:hypothetical protein